MLGSAWPQHFNKTGRRGDVRQHQGGRPAEVGARRTRRWPRAIQKELKQPDSRAADRARARCSSGVAPEQNTGGGSDDIGDVSWNVPTVTLRYPVQHPEPARAQLGQRDRDGDADRAQGRDRRRQGPGDDDRSICCTRPELVTQAWDYFRDVQTKDTKYVPLIGPDDKPALELNQRHHGRKYRPAMRKYYYDPTKYKTYLEQLGIKYPTVR